MALCQGPLLELGPCSTWPAMQHLVGVCSLEGRACRLAGPDAADTRGCIQPGWLQQPCPGPARAGWGALAAASLTPMTLMTQPLNCRDPWPLKWAQLAGMCWCVHLS